MNMNVLFSRVQALIKKHSIKNLNVIAMCVYNKDYTIEEAVALFQLNIEDMKYCTEIIQQYHQHANYIKQRVPEM